MPAEKNSYTTSSAGIQELRSDEGSIDGIYDDPSGYCTYGVGHLVHPNEKWGCFLLEAAAADDTWKAQVKTKWPGKQYALPYLPRTVVGSGQFVDLQKKAVDTAKRTVAQKKFTKPFDELDAGEQKKSEEIAKIAVSEQARLLNLDVDSVLMTDLKPFEHAVNESVTGVALTQNEFDALVSLAFNIGVNNFKSSTVLKKVNEGSYRSGPAANRTAGIKAIEESFLKWNRSGGKVLAGLSRRRKSEADRFLKDARGELAKMTKPNVPGGG